MAELLIENLHKQFGPVHAVEDVNIHVADGEFVTLLGPSGCGKSTTLGAIAGLEQPTSGRIRVSNKTYVAGDKGIFLPPEARNCGLVFQSYALWPHMTVYDNVVFPLTLRKVSTADCKRRVTESLALVEMERFQDRYPHQLSGGQQQRVALARTLGYRPELLFSISPCRISTPSCATAPAPGLPNCARALGSRPFMSPMIRSRRWPCPTASW